MLPDAVEMPKTGQGEEKPGEIGEGLTQGSGDGLTEAVGEGDEVKPGTGSPASSFR